MSVAKLLPKLVKSSSWLVVLLPRIILYITLSSATTILCKSLASSNITLIVANKTKTTTTLVTSFVEPLRALSSGLIKAWINEKLNLKTINSVSINPTL